MLNLKDRTEVLHLIFISLIFTTQVDPRGWEKLFEDPVISEAIVNRLERPSQNDSAHRRTSRRRLYSHRERKKVGLQPEDLLKYVTTENWHGRKLKTSKDDLSEKLGINNRVKFPPKDQWQVPSIANSASPAQA